MSQSLWEGTGEGETRGYQSNMVQRNRGDPMQTFKNVLELVLLQGGPHHLLYGRDVLVEFDHQRVVVHALHVGHNGVVALLGQGDQVVEAVHPGSKRREMTKTEIFLWHTENLDLSGDKGVEKRQEKKIIESWNHYFIVYWWALLSFLSSTTCAVVNVQLKAFQSVY